MLAMEGRRERKKHEVRRRILDAAFDLMGHDGVGATRIEAIATRADISQATFFNYFPSKGALVDAMLERLLDDVDEALAAACDAAAGERLRLVFSRSVELKVRQRNLMRELIAEASRSPADDGPMARLRSMFADLVMAGRSAGEFRADRAPEVLTDAVVGMYTSVVTRWTLDDDFPVAERFDAAAEMATELLAPRPVG